MAKIRAPRAEKTPARSSTPRTKVLPAPDEFVQDFRKLGFTDYEAKAYLTLCQVSPATAYEISKIAGLGKANVYSALESLVRRGAAQPVSQAPVKFVPLEPAVLLGQIAKVTSARCKELAGKLERVEPIGATDYVWTIGGEENIHIKVGEMIGRARQHVWIKAPHDLLRKHVAALDRAVKRGVELVMVLFGPEDCLAEFSFGARSTVYLHEGTGTMIGPAHQLITITVDFSEALTANLGEVAHGAFTRSSPIVYMAEGLLRHEVYLAKIFQKFGRQIEREFGTGLAKLRETYLPAGTL